MRRYRKKRKYNNVDRNKVRCVYVINCYPKTNDSKNIPVKDTENNDNNRIHKINKVKKSFIKTVTNIWRDKEDSHGKRLSESLALLTQVAFTIIFVVAILFCLILLICAVLQIIQIIQCISNKNWVELPSSIFNSIFYLFLSFLAFLIATVFKGASNDITHEKDKHYIINVFSAMVGLFGLIITLVTIFKGDNSEQIKNILIEIKNMLE